MDFARGLSPTSTDDYFVTAHQIFEGCGVESTSSLRVDALMDQFAPFVKTNQAECSFLKNLLDPDHCNPEINVSNLANALHQYSESQKSKMDLDESFNLMNGQGTHDADSGISTDGLQLLEDLQCELKEKNYLASQLKSQLAFTDRQHEETIAVITADRDAMRRHLNIVREENSTLTHIRRDYDDVCERLCISGAALDEAKRELETLRRCARVTREQLALLESDKQSLQDLLSKSKDECHRINEMYAARQSALLEENETLKSQHADLSCRMQDQDEFLQQVIKDKVLLEMELKDMLNKSNQTQLRLDRSIDVSYTDDQMLTALDSLNADSRFSTGNRILDDESFMNALTQDQGRCTNMSLFDEIRMSFNVSRLNVTEFNKTHCDKCGLDNSVVAAETQTDFEPYSESDKDKSITSAETQLDLDEIFCLDANTDTQTEPYVESDKVEDKINAETQTEINEAKLTEAQIECNKAKIKTSVDTQTEFDEAKLTEAQIECNKVKIKTSVDTQTDIDKEIKKEMVNVSMQTDSVINKNQKTDKEDITNNDVYCGGDNAQNRKFFNAVRQLNFDASFEDGLIVDYKAPFEKNIVKAHSSTQTDAIESVSENNVQFLDATDFKEIACQTIVKCIRKPPQFIKKARKLMALKKKQEINKDAGSQTDEIAPCVNNNNAHCTKCIECDDNYTIKLERDVSYAQMVIKEMGDKLGQYEENLTSLEALMVKDTDNAQQRALVDELSAKIEIIQNSCEMQRDVINIIVSPDTSSVQSQTSIDHTSVSTQAELDCPKCVRREAVAPHRGIRKYFWEPLKCLFQFFAVVCFVGAISVLYGVTRRGAVRCERGGGATPWRWFNAQDIMDLLLRIEYTAEVPM